MVSTEGPLVCLAPLLPSLVESTVTDQKKGTQQSPLSKPEACVKGWAGLTSDL